MGYFFVLLYLVVLYLRPAEWVPAMRSWQLVDVTLIGAGIFVLLFMAVSRKRFVAVPHNRFLLGFYAAILASHAVHTYLGGVINAFTAFAKIAIVYFLVVNTVTTERKFKVALWLMVLLTAVVALQGVQQFEAGRGWAGQKLISGRITWVSIFNDPNDLALAFIIVVPLLLSFIFKRSFFAMKFVPLGLLALVLYAIYLTNSRGGLLGLVATLMFYFIKKSRWVVPGGILGGLFGLLVFLFGPSRLGAISGTEASAQGRLEAWYYGFQLLKANPLFGVGQSLFTDAYNLTAHNSFVLAAAELGLIGLFFWVGLLYMSFKSLSIIQKRAVGLAPLAYGLQAALIGFMATAFFLSRTYNELPYLLCALSAALFHIARTQTDSVDFRVRLADVRNVVLLCVGVLGLTQVAMKTWL